MATQVLTIVTFTLLIVARIEPVSTYKISSADPDAIRINLGHKRLVKETVPLHSKLLIKCNFDAPSWFKNGKPITTDNRRAKSLKFNSIKKTDAGYYSCGSEFSEWSNLTLSVFSQHEAADHYQSDSPGGGGSSTGAVANLEKKSLSSSVAQNNELSSEEPVFVVGSRDLVVTVSKKEGESYRLKCEVAGEPKFKITWIKDGEVFNTKTGNRSNVLMEFLTSKDSGVYVCKVCNTVVCVNSTTKIEVMVDSEEPMISYNNMEKHSQVSNSDEPVGVDYVDDHNGEDYDEEEGGEDEGEDEDEEGEGSQKGSVHETSETTENQPALGGAGGDLPPGKPFFTKPDQLVSLMPKPSGNMVRLRCPAAGNPMPNITWTKNDTAVQRNMGSVKYAKWSS